MNRFQRWQQTLPLPAFYVMVFIFWTGIQVLFHLGDRRLGFDIVVYVIGGLIVAAVLTGLMATRRRRAGGAQGLIEMNQAQRTGQLPADADANVWAPELERRERQLTRNGWMSPIFFGALVVFGIVGLVLGLAPLPSALIIVIALGLGVFSFVSSRRYLARVRSLREQLGAPSGTGQAHFTSAGFPRPPR